jgi:regulator of replication initiation timing
LGNQQLGQITNQLDTVEQIAQLSDKNRDLQRRNNALERRLEECESILDQKDKEKEEAENLVGVLKREINQMSS